MRKGDEVTVIPDEREDPYILQFQRYATVSRTDGSSCWIRLGNTYPAGREYGPIPKARLLPGWKDRRGEWRHW